MNSNNLFCVIKNTYFEPCNMCRYISQKKCAVNNYISVSIIIMLVENILSFFIQCTSFLVGPKSGYI